MEMMMRLITHEGYDRNGAMVWNMWSKDSSEPFYELMHDGRDIAPIISQMVTINDRIIPGTVVIWELPVDYYTNRLADGWYVQFPYQGSMWSRDLERMEKSTIPADYYTNRLRDGWYINPNCFQYQAALERAAIEYGWTNI